MNGKRMLCFWIGFCLLVSLYGCAVEPMPESGGSGSNDPVESMEASLGVADRSSQADESSKKPQPINPHNLDCLQEDAVVYHGEYGYILSAFLPIWNIDANVQEGMPCRFEDSNLHPMIMTVAKALPDEQIDLGYYYSDCPLVPKLLPPSEAGRIEWQTLLASWGLILGTQYSSTTEVPADFGTRVWAVPPDDAHAFLKDVSAYDFYRIDLSTRDMEKLCELAAAEDYFVCFYCQNKRLIEPS